MFCKYCGNELTEDAVFCSKCGKRIGTGAEESPAHENVPVQEEDSVKEEEPVQVENQAQEEFSVQAESTMHEEVPVQEEVLVKEEVPVQEESPLQVANQKLEDKEISLDSIAECEKSEELKYTDKQQEEKGQAVKKTRNKFKVAAIRLLAIVLGTILGFILFMILYYGVLDLG